VSSTTALAPAFYDRPVLEVARDLVGGTLLFYQALARGKASVVLPMTAMYPALTVVLALLILGEVVSLKQGLGILFALIAVILLA
jgi:transporter family protein